MVMGWDGDGQAATYLIPSSIAVSMLNLPGAVGTTQQGAEAAPPLAGLAQAQSPLMATGSPAQVPPGFMLVQ